MTIVLLPKRQMQSQAQMFAFRPQSSRLGAEETTTPIVAVSVATVGILRR